MNDQSLKNAGGARRNSGRIEVSLTRAQKRQERKDMAVARALRPKRKPHLLQSNAKQVPPRPRMSEGRAYWEWVAKYDSDWVKREKAEERLGWRKPPPTPELKIEERRRPHQQREALA